MNGSSYFCRVIFKKVVPGYNHKTRKYIRGCVVDIEFVDKETEELEKDNIWVDASVYPPDSIEVGGYYSVYRAKNGYVIEFFKQDGPTEAYMRAQVKNWGR